MCPLACCCVRSSLKRAVALVCMDVAALSFFRGLPVVEASKFGIFVFRITPWSGLTLSSPDDTVARTSVYSTAVSALVVIPGCYIRNRSKISKAW